MALACTWGSYADTDLDFSEFFGGNHTVAVRFMLQYPKAYTGPMVSVKGGGTYLIAQGDYREFGQQALFFKVGTAQQAKMFTVTTPVAAGTWHHLTVVRTAGEYAVYLDGMAMGSLVVPPGPGPAGTVRFGRGIFHPFTGGDEQFYGFLDDVAVFTRALSATEVTGLVTAHHLTGTEPDLLAGYTFSYVPPGGLPPALARPLTSHGPGGQPSVSLDRDNEADAAHMPVPRTSHMHVPFPAGQAWRVIQGYEGPEHTGPDAFRLNLALASDPPPSGGRPFLAAAPGVVDFVHDGDLPGKGNFVSVRQRDHEFCDYLHVVSGSSAVKAGDEVAVADQLAVVGDAGAATPHLQLAVTNMGEGNQGPGDRLVTIPAPLHNYEVFHETGKYWYLVERGIPQVGEQIRQPAHVTGPGAVVVARKRYGWVVQDLSIATLPMTSRVVLACNTDGELSVSVEEIDDTSCIVNKGTSPPSPETVILTRVCGLSPSRAVTAVQTSARNLKVIVWDVDEAGMPSRRGEASAGGVEQIAVAALTPSRFATVVATQALDLKVIIWDVGADGTVTRRGDALGGKVNQGPAEVSVASLSEGRLFSANRPLGGSALEVIVWDVDAAGNVIRRADATSEPVRSVAVGAYSAKAAVTYVGDMSDNLKVIIWYLGDDELVRGTDRAAYPVFEVASAGPAVCATRDDIDAKVRVGWWQITPGQPDGIINPIADGASDPALNISAALLPPVPKPPSTLTIGRVATLGQDGQRAFVLTVWHLVGSSIH